MKTSANANYYKVTGIINLFATTKHLYCKFSAIKFLQHRVTPCVTSVSSSCSKNIYEPRSDVNVSYFKSHLNKIGSSPAAVDYSTGIVYSAIDIVTRFSKLFGDALENFIVFFVIFLFSELKRRVLSNIGVLSNL